MNAVGFAGEPIGSVEIRDEVSGRPSLSFLPINPVNGIVLIEHGTRLSPFQDGGLNDAGLYRCSGPRDRVARIQPEGSIFNNLADSGNFASLNIINGLAYPCTNVTCCDMASRRAA